METIPVVCPCTEVRGQSIFAGDKVPGQNANCPASVEVKLNAMYSRCRGQSVFAVWEEVASEAFPEFLDSRGGAHSSASAPVE